jgi:Ser/Thr protein kinase RdoA (MazF antagonist)
VDHLKSGATEVFRVEANGRRLALRLYRAKVGDGDPLAGDAVLRTRRGLGEPAMLLAQLDWLDRMFEGGLAVPAVVTDRSGRRVHRFRPQGPRDHPRPVRHALVLEWVEGHPVSADASPAEMTKVGAYVARAHNVAADIPSPRPDLLPRWDWDWVFGRGAAMWTNGPSVLDTAQMATVERAATAIELALARIGRTPDTFGMIHRDLKLDNLILGGRDVCAIDFDHTGLGYYLHDLAVLRTSLLIMDRDRARQLWPAFLKGYRARRRLPDDHAVHLGAMRALQVAAGLNRAIEQSLLRPELRGPPAGSPANAVRRLESWLEMATGGST